MEKRECAKTVVLHSYSLWLPLTQTWLYNQVRCLPPDFESHVACESTDNLDLFPLEHIHSLSEEPRMSAFLDRAQRDLGFRNHLNFLSETALGNGAEILHSHFGHTGWADLGAAKEAKLKQVVTFYGLDVNYLPRKYPWKKRYGKLFKAVDRVLCEGHFMAGAIEALGCPKEKITVHHLGVDLDAIPWHPREWKAGEPLKILIAAAFREKKGIPYAIEALGRLKNDFPLEITVIGDANGEKKSQREKGRILKAIAESGLGSRVRLLGYQPHSVLFEEAYKNHIFLSPSVTAEDGDTEGGAPVSILEMSASGMPIVATTHCDIPEIVEHGKTGFLADERNVDELVKYVGHVAEHPECWHEWGRAGRDHVSKEYDARIQGERLGRIYQEVLEK